jgi:hypothetical protein
VALPSIVATIGGSDSIVDATDIPEVQSPPAAGDPAGEDKPQSNPRVPSIGEYSFSQLLPYDGIRPVYDPDFAAPQQVENLLQDDELVLGMNLGDEAKAYPISVLRFREMVNDEMAGIPTLVTW